MCACLFLKASTSMLVVVFTMCFYVALHVPAAYTRECAVLQSMGTCILYICAMHVYICAMHVLCMCHAFCISVPCMCYACVMSVHLSCRPLLIPLGSGNRPNGPYAPPHHAPFAANAAAAGNAYFDAMRTADWSTPPSTQDDSVPPSAVVVSGQSHQSAMARQASLSPSVGGGSNGHGNGHGVVGAHAGHHGGPPLVFTSRGLGEDAISHHLEQLERNSGAQQSDGSGGGSGDANRPTSPWDAVAAAAAAVARGVADLDLSAATPPAHPTATTHTNTTGNTDTSTAAAAAAALHTALGAAVGDDHAHADIFAGLHSGELLTFEDIDLSLLLQDDTHSDHA